MEIKVLFLLLVFSISLILVHGEEAKTTKFREREATDNNLRYPNIDENGLLNKQCPQNLKLRWQTKVSSNIHATPLIADINSDGKLDVVVPSFVHYLEVLEGSNGEKMPGWPTFHESTVHASPLLYDIDKDGIREIALATYNGEVLFFRSSGYMMPDKLEIPRLKAKRDWYVGLLPDPVDRSHPDVYDDFLIEEAVIHSMPSSKEASHTSRMEENKGRENEMQPKPEPPNDTKNTYFEQPVNNSTKESDAENKTSADIELPNNTSNATSITIVEDIRSSRNETKTRRRLLEENSQEKKDQKVEYNYDYEDYVDETMWGHEEWIEAQHEAYQNYVLVDSHILCTPVIADIDQDGISEMIVAVSYFFDHEYYDNPEHLKELGSIDTGKYVGGGIVVFNLETKQVKWTAELDLSTDTAKFRAYIYSSPTVVDLDGDGFFDILVGTSYGLVYVLDHTGKLREKFPLVMAEIQGAVVAADINDDGKIELVTTDTHGNVAAWTPQGVEIWETHLKSLIPQGVSVGDVDGDGHTDVVVPTISGNIYVLSGKDGSFVRPYPYRTHGKVMNQVLLVDLSKREETKKGLTIVTTSFDGYLYLIDGPTSCADVVDIGEASYSMVLADDVDGGDDLDLIVTTMNGNVFCFSTPAPHHPLKARRLYNQGRNNIAARVDRERVYVTPLSIEEGKYFLG